MPSRLALLALLLPMAAAAMPVDVQPEALSARLAGELRPARRLPPRDRGLRPIREASRQGPRRLLASAAAAGVPARVRGPVLGGVAGAGLDRVRRYRAPLDARADRRAAPGGERRDPPVGERQARARGHCPAPVALGPVGVRGRAARRGQLPAAQAGARDRETGLLAARMRRARRAAAGAGELGARAGWEGRAGTGARS